MRITNPGIFAGRLSRDAMHGWAVFHCEGSEEDTAVRLGRYPIKNVGRGYMEIALNLPSDFEKLFRCHKVSILSRKMQPLHAFSVSGQITSEVKSIVWIP